LVDALKAVQAEILIYLHKGARGVEFRTWVPDAAKAYACWLSAPLILVIEA